MDQTAWEVWQAGQKDPAYRLLLEQMTALEERFEVVMGSQDQEMQDVRHLLFLCSEREFFKAFRIPESNDTLIFIDPNG